MFTMTENDKPRIMRKYRVRIINVANNKEFDMPHNCMDVKTEVNMQTGVMTISWLEPM